MTQASREHSILPNPPQRGRKTLTKQLMGTCSHPRWGLNMALLVARCRLCPDPRAAVDHLQHRAKGLPVVPACDMQTCPEILEPTRSSRHPCPRHCGLSRHFLPSGKYLRNCVSGQTARATPPQEINNSELVTSTPEASSPQKGSEASCCHSSSLQPRL